MNTDKNKKFCLSYLCSSVADFQLAVGRCPGVNMTSAPTAGRRSAALTPRVKVWLEAGGRYAFGFGISEILQAVGRAGSIKQAAADLGKSYRHVWGRIKAAEAALGRPLV